MAVAAEDSGVSRARRSAGTGGQHHSLCQGKSQADAGGPLACLRDSVLGGAQGCEVSCEPRHSSCHLKAGAPWAWGTLGSKW